MHMDFIRRHILILASGLALTCASPAFAADPPSRVGRLGYINGAVSFSPAGENDWVQASLNRPLGTGDRLWTEMAENTRAEIQVAGAAIRMDAGTSLSVLNLDDDIAQVLLNQGSLHVRVRRLGPRQSFEVATPNLAFTLRQPGEYRIEVDPRNDATIVVVHQGRGEAWGEDAAYEIKAPQAWRFVGSRLHDYEQIGVPRADAFDRWAASRDDGYDNSRSARYVSADVIGYQDLDAHGSWRVDAGYGNVWVPARMAADWAPYSDGHWAWIDPWGWTWIDDAPWGFAVSHYGRWANLRGTWAWVPGPVRAQAYYAPALVAFVGGDHFQLTIATGMIGAVAWFPLAPRDVYRPSYPVSRRYFENVNRSNTVINNTVIVKQYNNTQVTNIVYANRQVAGAVVAVPRTAFVQAQPVSRDRQRVSREVLAGQPVQLVPAVVPTEQSVRGTTAKGAPPPRGMERQAVARSTVPPVHPGLAAQREQLAEKPGRPLDTASRRQLKNADPVTAPVVKVLPPRDTVKKLASPPVAGPVGRPTTSARQTDTAKPLPDNKTQVQRRPEASAIPDAITRPEPGARPDASLRPEPPSAASAQPALVPATPRRGVEALPAAGPDKDEAPRRASPPVPPVAAPPKRPPGEPAGKPVRDAKPKWEQNDQPKFPVRGEATPLDDRPAQARVDAVKAREPVARSAPPAASAQAAPPSAAREAVVVDAKRARDKARDEKADRRQDEQRQGQR
jgi:hypothetical protein